jgi:hypothetical protein
MRRFARVVHTAAVFGARLAEAVTSSVLDDARSSRQHNLARAGRTVLVPLGRWQEQSPPDLRRGLGVRNDNPTAVAPAFPSRSPHGNMFSRRNQ